MITKETKNSKNYIEAVGRRKSATVRVRIYPTSVPQDIKGKFVINDKDIKNYITTLRYREKALAPLKLIGEDAVKAVSVKAVGGGIMAQADAICLGLARAMTKLDGDLKKKFRYIRNFSTKTASQKQRLIKLF